MKELRKINMAASSSRGAIFSLRLLALNEGFAVEARRGAGGKFTGKEMYWRSTEMEAFALYDSIVRRKTASGRKRIYREANIIEQMLLFEA